MCSAHSEQSRNAAGRNGKLSSGGAGSADGVCGGQFLGQLVNALVCAEESQQVSAGRPQLVRAGCL
jgi:hypothetical protein